VYTAAIGETIYVLHAFQKKSKRGIATPARELSIIRARLLAARKRELQSSKEGAQP
jgi:phage-related protein